MLWLAGPYQHLSAETKDDSVHSITIFAPLIILHHAATLVWAAPASGARKNGTEFAVVNMIDYVDEPVASDPTAFDPKTPPASLDRWRPDGGNPFEQGIPTLPSVCNDLWSVPSKECVEAGSSLSEGVVAFGGGSLKFEGGSCESKQQQVLATAAWDAYTLTRFAKTPPTSGKHIATWRAYIGPDFSSVQDRITSQYLLHEMMHLEIVGQPKIIDHHVEETETGRWAYGPGMVHKFAQRTLNQGGGGQRSSTNSDSCAWLANSLYFYQVTNYFPQPPGYKDLSANDRLSSGQLAQMETVFPVNLGHMNFSEATWTSQESALRFDVALEGMKNPPPAMSTPPPGDISSPNCAYEGPGFAQSLAERHIHDFCSNEGYWDKVIVPPISLGLEQTSDGRQKLAGVAQGDEKRDHCKSRLRTVLNGCGTDTVTAKKGGTLADGCREYGVFATETDPFDEWYTDEGGLECEDRAATEESPLKGTCTCWYSGYPALSDIFKRPGSNSCRAGDIDLKNLVRHDTE
ncbi:hypothetical protein CSAL01_12233 [Colletotrichum salicis]|uniref:Metalloprotease n=1 Tax=Colletotrichum salicis TaxID=1209931 RepID=A0A135V5N4_9PEZI|nr:hypothetical protein CSAL01_12233 [Colletotrichum salicis]